MEFAETEDGIEAVMRLATDSFVNYQSFSINSNITSDRLHNVCCQKVDPWVFRAATGRPKDTLISTVMTIGKAILFNPKEHVALMFKCR